MNCALGDNNIDRKYKLDLFRYNYFANKLYSNFTDYGLASSKLIGSNFAW